MFTNKQLNIKQLLSIIIVVLITTLVLSSCDKAKDALDDTTKAVGDAANKAGEVAGDAVDKVGDAAKDVTDKAGEVAGDAVNKVTDVFSNNGMVGTWSGKFDSRATKLIITEQDKNNFNGKITINYKNIIHQDVKGTYNPETKTITMTDQLRSRYKGSYKATISEDGKTLKGVFTVKLDGKKRNFKLTKK